MKMVQKQRVQLKLKALLVIKWKLLFRGGNKNLVGAFFLVEENEQTFSQRG